MTIATQPRALKARRSVLAGRFLSLLLGTTLIVLNVGHSISTEYASRAVERFPKQATTAVLVAECIKLLLALPAFLYKVYAKPEHFTQLTFRVVLRLAVCSVLYTVVNFLSYFAIRDLGSTLYQLLSNMKVITTATLFRIFLRKRLRVVQWLCIVQLTVALFIGTEEHHASLARQDSSLTRGIFGMLCISIASALAGVYFEFSMKNSKTDPIIQNFVLYCWTVLLSSIQLCTTHSLTGDLMSSIRFSSSMWAAIFTSSFYGQVVALLLYYRDNMLKVFASSLGTFVSSVVEHFVFGYSLHKGTCCGGLLAIIVTVVYYSDHNVLLLYDDQVALECA